MTITNVPRALQRLRACDGERRCSKKPKGQPRCYRPAVWRSLGSRAFVRYWCDECGREYASKGQAEFG